MCVGAISILTYTSSFPFQPARPHPTSAREESKGNLSCGAGVVAEEPNPEFGRLRRGLLRMLSTSQYYQPEDKLSLLPRNKVCCSSQPRQDTGEPLI